MTARRATATLLAALAGLLAVIGAACWVVSHGVIAQDAFADRAVSALHHDAVRDAVSQEIFDQVDREVPDVAASPAQVRKIVDRVVSGISFERVYRDGALLLNQALLHGQGDDATLRVNLADVLRPTSPQLAAVVGDRDVTIVSLDGGTALDRTNTAGDVIRVLGVMLPFFAAAALVAALLLAPSRGRAIGALGSVAALTGAVLFGVLVLARSRVDDAVDLVGTSTTQTHDAAVAIWEVYASGARTVAIVAVVAGLLLAVGGFAVGSRRGRTRPLNR